MQIILAHNHHNVLHLASVMGEMRSLGAPTIRAVWVECWGAWVAIEGCHRLRAAHALGLVPEIDPVEYSDDMLSTVLGADLQGDDHMISAWVDSSWGNTTLEF